MRTFLAMAAHTRHKAECYATLGRHSSRRGQMAPLAHLHTHTYMRLPLCACVCVQFQVQLRLLLATHAHTDTSRRVYKYYMQIHTHTHTENRLIQQLKLNEWVAMSTAATTAAHYRI